MPEGIGYTSPQTQTIQARPTTPAPSQDTSVDIEAQQRQEQQRVEAQRLETQRADADERLGTQIDIQA